jgi:hypothetical protein
MLCKASGSDRTGGVAGYVEDRAGNGNTAQRRKNRSKQLQEQKYG